ncbi:MAG: MFS transporter [Curvibacter sp.]|nr:MFS transporter [Curvibacter sp.]
MPLSEAGPARPLHDDAQLDRRAILALVAILTGVALGTLDTAIANTALPTIAGDLKAPPAASIWVINAYQLAVVATLLPFATLGDLLGPRRVFMAGLAVFTAASLACALAGSLPTLAAARALQGVGAGGIMSVNIALIRLIYPASRLGRGVGMNALVVGVGFAVGPTLASLILTLAPWPWLFAVNVPLGLAALALGLRALPRSERRQHSFDPLTAGLTALTFASLIGALGSAAQREPLGLVALPLGLCLVAGAALLWRQRGHPAPMLPVDLLARPMFLLSTLTAMGSFAAQGLAFVSLPFYFEEVLHRNPVDTGFLMTAWPIVVAAAAPIAGRLSDRHPPGLLGGIGLAILSLGLASMALLPDKPSALEIVLRMAVCGAGFGFFQSPNLRALMSSAPPERASGASGMIAMARLIGQTTGAALVALCFGLAGTHGSVAALALGAGFAALASAASAARLWAR